LQIKLILTATESALADAWRKFCGDLEFVQIHEGSILDLSCDAVVSPANSFGFMDGGIDARYSERWGWGVQEKLQKLIVEKHHGELVVGAAEIVETGDLTKPYLIAAPTMRVPMILGPETVNPYLAIRAVLLLIEHEIFSEGENKGSKVREHVESVAFPGIGTGVGRVPFAVCAHQFRMAVEDVVLHKGNFPRTWAEASERHQLLYTDRLRRLQH